MSGDRHQTTVHDSRDVESSLYCTKYLAHELHLGIGIRIKVENMKRQHRFSHTAVKKQQISILFRKFYKYDTNFMNERRRACAVCQTPTHVMNEAGDDISGAFCCHNTGYAVFIRRWMASYTLVNKQPKLL